MVRPVYSLLALLLAGAVSGTLAAAPRPGSKVSPSAGKPAAGNLLMPRPDTPRPEVFDTPSRPMLALQVGHSDGIRCVAYAPDGRTLVTGGDDQSLRMWDMRTGQVKGTLEGHEAPVECVAYSPDGKLIATGADDRTVRLWDAQNGQLRAIFRGHLGTVWNLAFSPDGKWLASGSWDKTIRLWNVAARKPGSVFTGHSDRILALAFSPDGKWLLSGGADNLARLWNASTGLPGPILRGHKHFVQAVAFSPDGKALATGSFDGGIRLWSPAGKPLKALDGHTLAIQSLAFSPDGKTLASGSWDKTARLWDTTTGACSATLSGHTERLWKVAFSPDGSLLATGGADNTARLWTVSTGQLRTTLQGHTSWVLTLAFSPDGKSLATAGSESRAIVWDVESGQARMVLPRNGSIVVAHTYSPDGKTLVTGSSDNLARVWNADTGELRATLSGHLNWVTGLAFSPDGKTLVTGSLDQELRVWDAESGHLRTRLPKFPARIFALTYAPDGKSLAVAGDDQLVRILDAATGAEKSKLTGHTQAVTSLAFSRDSRRLVTGCFDSTARVWDVSSGQTISTCRGHLSPIRAVAFSADGKRVATGSGDETARVWDAMTGRPLSMMPVKNQHVASVAFSNNGKVLAAVTRTGQVLQWDAAKATLLPAAAQVDLSEFTYEISQPLSIAGAAITMHDPKDGRELATLVPIPQMSSNKEGGDSAGAVLAALDKNPNASMASSEWFVTTPEGYFDCSINAARFIRWNVGGTLYPTERYIESFRRPDLVRQALARERIAAKPISQQDVPPDAWFVDFKPGEAEGGTATVVIQASDDKDLSRIDLRVNGRPLPAEQAVPVEAKPIELAAKPIELAAKPIELAAKPIELPAKPIEFAAKPIELAAKPIELAAKPIEFVAKPIELVAKELDPHHTMRKQYTYKIHLPNGTDEIHITAIAYDLDNLTSDPVELTLKRQQLQKEITGSLYVLSVGVAKYKNSDGKGFRDLTYPAIDAKSIADRFRREGKPLYEKVEVRTLLDNEATLENIRGELKNLQSKVRPGQIDTVVVFLSGHGVSVDGKYYFATHDLSIKDKAAIAQTGLTGKELRDALGSKLHAKSVFLFVDTCHAGAMTGRNDDLAMEVGDGIFMMASTGGKNYSYESSAWGHGAFTYALLRALERKELARDGVIRFNSLVTAVPDEVANLMKDAGRNEAEQEPVIPLASLRLRAPLVQAAP